MEKLILSGHKKHFVENVQSIQLLLQSLSKLKPPDDNKTLNLLNQWETSTSHLSMSHRSDHVSSNHPEDISPLLEKH